MTLNKREKMYAAVVGVLALVAVYCMWPSNQMSLSELRDDYDKKSKTAKELEDKVLKGRRAEAQLTAWQKAALPPDTKEAARLYNAWLSTVTHENLKSVEIHPTDPQTTGDIYTKFTFTINSQGTLANLVQFMQKFYSAGHLHKIRMITIEPVPKSTTDLTLMISVEALSLPGSKQTIKLSEEKSNRLKLPTLDAYKNAIANRNIFAAYRATPPDRGVTPPPTPTDPLQYCYLSGIVKAGGIQEALLNERTTGEIHKVHEGEEFTIGRVKAKVNRIGATDIEVEINGRKRTVILGNNLNM